MGFTAIPAALAAAAVLAIAAPAGAGAGTAGPAPAPRASAIIGLRLRAMPTGRVTFGRDGQGQLTVHAVVSGLTPGSSHDVDLTIPGRSGLVRFSPLTAAGTGRADATLTSMFTGTLRHGSRLLIRLGQGSGFAGKAIAQTGRLAGPAHGRHRLIAVEVGPDGRNWGTPRGQAILSYNAAHHTLTVAVQASGLTPGRHAAHIHLGSCRSQGAIKYSLGDLVADRHGAILPAIRVFRNVTAPVPAHGWYLNIHQGNMNTIVSNGKPTIFFRPLLCADIRGR